MLNERSVVLGMSFIGPVIPSQLRAEQAAQSSDSDSDDNYGPRLPTEPCRGPAPAPPPASHQPRDDTSDSEEDFGPALPPHLQKQKPSDSHQRDSDSSDEEYVGPKMSEITTSVNRESVEAEVEMRARRMRDKLEGKDQVEVQRESWMLELPEEKANRFGLGPRQFSRKGVTQRGGDRSAWTDTPEDKERKLREGEDGEQEEQEDNFDIAARMRDEKMEKVSRELKQKRGADSLMDMHEKKIKKDKKKKEDSGEVSERRPFDRDVDLKANQFDEAMKKNMMKMAAKIDNRFSSGSQKFL